MNIAIIGHGKMGKLVEKTSIERGHQIVHAFNSPDWSSNDLHGVDVAIEFSSPKNALENIKKSLEAGVSIVVGTTGWYNDIEKVKAWVQDYNGSFLAATNFSIGVNIFYEINKKLASLINKHSSYKPLVKEIHHTEKLDSPSGTAISIANQIVNQIDSLSKWKESKDAEDSTLNILSERKEGVAGFHEVFYENEIDKITISHEAKNRNGFALGAVVAAEFLSGKKGFYSLSDVVKF